MNAESPRVIVLWVRGAAAITPAGGQCFPIHQIHMRKHYNFNKNVFLSKAGNNFEPFKQTINIQELVQTQTQTTTSPKNSTNGGLPSERFK